MRRGALGGENHENSMTLYFDACTFAVLTCQRSGPGDCSVAAEFLGTFCKGHPSQKRPKDFYLKTAGIPAGQADHKMTASRWFLY